MHTTSCGDYNFHHNGDYSGEIVISHKPTGNEFEIPFETLIFFMAEWKRQELSRHLDLKTSKDILLT